MSETRTATERLDAMLSGLEDDVLGTGAVEREETDETGARERVEMIRSDIEALIGSRSRAATGPEPGRGVGRHALGAKAKVAETMARFGRRVGLGPHARGGSATPRVRMAFSGARSETGKSEESEERKNAGQRKVVRDDDGKSGG